MMTGTIVDVTASLDIEVDDDKRAGVSAALVLTRSEEAAWNPRRDALM